MRIIIDSAIPYINGLFEPYAEVLYREGSNFLAEEVRDADALIIRTRTRCNAELLRGSRVRHIATATIGFDHIDLDYCRQNGIKVTTAAGCNARGVLHWFGALMSHLSGRDGWQPTQKRLGVVGVGNVGRLIKEYAEAWGFEVVCCDPLRQIAEDLDFVELEELLRQCDIVTLHTPLDSSTHHMVGAREMAMMKSGALLVNASRGEVVDSDALHNSDLNFAFDVWEHEPNIDKDLLQRAKIATSHIAGYSLQGKANGSSMVVADIAQHFDIPLDGWYPDIEKITPRLVSWGEMQSVIMRHMDIEAESRYLKDHPSEFEHLRNNYNYRGEIF
ncbi:MAG: 4-phosphoerythronate dehydrogenase [Rikenellaceae bacterium]